MRSVACLLHHEHVDEVERAVSRLVYFRHSGLTSAENVLGSPPESAVLFGMQCSPKPLGQCVLQLFRRNSHPCTWARCVSPMLPRPMKERRLYEGGFKNADSLRGAATSRQRIFQKPNQSKAFYVFYSRRLSPCRCSGWRCAMAFYGDQELAIIV